MTLTEKEKDKIDEITKDFFRGAREGLRIGFLRVALISLILIFLLLALIYLK